MLGDFRFFPALPENTATPSVPKRKPLRIPPEKQPIKRKNRLSAVSTDQAGRTVAGPLHSRNIKEKPNLSQSFTGKPQRIKAERQCVSKVTCGQKNTRNFVFSQLRCKFWQVESYIQKRGPTHQPSPGVARRLPPQLTLFCRYPPFVYKLDHKSKPHDRDRQTWRNILLIMDAKREAAVQKNSRLSAGRRPVGWLRQCR